MRPLQTKASALIRGAGLNDALYGTLLLVAMAVGVWLRLIGYFSEDMGLWLDEAFWAGRAVRGEYQYLARPQGFMWLTHQATVLWGVREQTLRAIPLLAGIGSLPAMYVLLRRLVTNRWCALATFYLFALHRVAIAMSKEFKPYSLELLLHLLLILCALTYWRRGGRVRLAVGCALAFATVWLSWSTVFLYPTFFVLLFWGAHRQGTRRQQVAIVGASIATFIALCSVFLTRFQGESTTSSEYWGKKYDVFYLGTSAVGRLAWYVEKTTELAAFPSRLHFLEWQHLAPIVLPVVSVALVATGLITCVARRRGELMIAFVLPIGVMIVATTLGRWPFGVFRTNTFTLAYSVPLLALGGAWALERPKLRASLVWGALLLIGLTLPTQPSVYRTKTMEDLAYSTRIPATMRMLAAHGPTQPPSEKIPLLADFHACGIYRFYLRHHDDFQGDLGERLSSSLEPNCKHLHADIRDTEKPYWLLHARRTGADKVLHWMRRAGCENTVLERSPATMLVRCDPRPESNAHAHGTSR